MELFRAAAALAEPPGDHTARLARLVGLDEPPTASDYTDLFVIQQPPYASAYLDADGTIGGESRDRVAGFWRALRLVPPDEPDHLATMLAAYAALCDRAGVETEARMRAALERAAHAFLWEHLLSWVPFYLHAVQRQTAGPFRRWAGLLLEALLEEARSGPAPGILPLHFREVPGMPDPRDGDPARFLAALLTPVLSGMIVTRADLIRAARLHGMGLRAGDRRLALRSLFEQDAPAALQWIASEARTWQGLHESLAPVTGPQAAFWAGRAAATAALVDALRRDAVAGADDSDRASSRSALR